MLILSQEKRKVVEIPIERIVPNPSQPRRIFMQTELDNLSNSIKESRIVTAADRTPSRGKPI